MKDFHQPEFCPRCKSSKITTWSDLTDEQKFLAERLPAAGHFSEAERKKHRFCKRCLFEFTSAKSDLA